MRLGGLRGGCEEGVLLGGVRLRICNLEYELQWYLDKYWSFDLIFKTSRKSLILNLEICKGCCGLNEGLGVSFEGPDHGHFL